MSSSRGIGPALSIYLKMKTNLNVKYLVNPCSPDRRCGPVQFHPVATVAHKKLELKGQWPENLCFRFINELSSSKHLKIALGSLWLFRKFVEILASQGAPPVLAVSLPPVPLVSLLQVANLPPVPEISKISKKGYFSYLMVPDVCVRHHVLFAYTDFSTRANLHLLACPTYIQKGWPPCSVLPTLGKIFRPEY